MSKATTDEEIQIDEIIKAIEDWQELSKPIQKIKMKEEVYNQLARETQKIVNIIEVNRVCGVKIEIDNSIAEGYEVVR